MRLYYCLDYDEASQTYKLPCFSLSMAKGVDGTLSKPLAARLIRKTMQEMAVNHQVIPLSRAGLALDANSILIECGEEWFAKIMLANHISLKKISRVELTKKLKMERAIMDRTLNLHWNSKLEVLLPIATTIGAGKLM